MTERYAAFISYSHRYKPWVATLQRHLEACLRAAGAEPQEVFLDQTDLASGRSWVTQLQAGVAQARHLILVATPESLASPRAADEWQAFVTRNRDYKDGRLHIVQLVEAPLPPFLDDIQRLDFVEHDAEQYFDQLRHLSGALQGLGPRQLPELPTGLEAPGPPDDLLPRKLRRRLVNWLAPLVEDRFSSLAVASCLSIEPTTFRNHPTPEGAASAALVAAIGDEHSVAGARRIVGSLREVLEGKDELLSELEVLAYELEALGEASEDGLVDRWLARVRLDHSQLVPFFEHADLELLDRVYVQLELKPEERIVRRHSEEPSQEKPEELSEDRQLTLRDALGLDPEKHPCVTRRWMVLGDPGAGKTTLLRHLAATLADDSDRRWIPIFESLPRMMRNPEWLLTRLERELRKAGEKVEGLEAALDREGQEGRLLLLLDGLDEVPKEDRDDAEALLRQLSARWPRSPLVVSSRPIGYRRPSSEFVELELLPFDENQRGTFLDRWFKRPNAARKPDISVVMHALRGDRGLWELSGNPLYLTLMALLFEEDQAPNPNRAKLYDQVFDLLLDGRHRPAGRPIDLKETVYEVLRLLAHDMTDSNLDSEPRSALESRLHKERYDTLAQELRRHPPWQHSLGSFLDELAQKTGILGPHDGPSADWRYWHRTFREALTSERLLGKLEAGGKEAIREKARRVAGDESRWAEPYALLVGRVRNPDSLVKALAEANRTLGLRALATAQNLRDETIQEVLQLTEDWGERRKVYGQIPDLMEDPERALALVDQLRRRTRNGNDLYFLNEALTATAERWPSAQRHADSLSARFFDHIPPPTDELFLWVDTPLDGRVPLWRAIPAGIGCIGAADGEEDHDDERPRHRVKIVHPFAMAAVPITNGQYAAFDPQKPFLDWRDVQKEKLPNHPRVHVTWFEATAFCRWLASYQSGARLPMEEEWEYACRAGTESVYWSGDREQDLARVGWYEANSEGRTHRVGKKPANPWGLYDMHENTFEWMLNRWDPKPYAGREKAHLYELNSRQLVGTSRERSRGGGRVIRGGSIGITAVWARSACRNKNNPTSEIRNLGFRVVFPAPESTD